MLDRHALSHGRGATTRTERGAIGLLLVSIVLMTIGCHPSSSPAAQGDPGPHDEARQPTPTVIPRAHSRWSRLHSQLYPYELDYPDDWQPSIVRDGGQVMDALDEPKPGSIRSDVSLRVYAAPADPAWSLDAYQDATFKTLQRRSAGRPRELSVKARRSLAGADGEILYARIPDVDHDWDSYIALALAGGRVWWLMFTSHPDRTASELPAFERVLDSFQVTE